MTLGQEENTIVSGHHSYLCLFLRMLPSIILFCLQSDYSAIVKLQIKYEGQDKGDARYAMGTGWLIDSDLLVTAGQIVYDHQYGYARATEIKAYVGYHGKEFVHTDSHVQFRKGVKVATTKNWIMSDVNRANDLSFIRVERPFDGIKPFEWEKTPTTGDFFLTVVGYPADQRSQSGEIGAEMYEGSAQTSFNLKTTASNMLDYQISAYAGEVHHNPSNRISANNNYRTNWITRPETG